MTLSPLQQYGLVTANYWAFTLTDGALRMLVLLYFYQLGYSPLEVAMMFVFYEFFGMVTNLLGGWLGAKLGLNVTMNLGLALQVVALGLLAVPETNLSVAYVMFAQGLSGVAKDLNKMSAKSAIKSLATQSSNQLYVWVSVLTGSKNALKGVGFFLGASLLAWLGFRDALMVLAALVFVPLVFSIVLLDGRLGQAKTKSKFSELFSRSAAINGLSAARFFLFGARDIWFVVALPVYLTGVLHWSEVQVGTFMALWVMGYGGVQALSPRITRLANLEPNKGLAMKLALLLALVPLLMAGLLNWQPETVVVLGLVVFGVMFALNSAVHSFLIVHFSAVDGASKDVGFYYMANAGGRLVGTVLSGYVYQQAGLVGCLVFSGCFIFISAILAKQIK